MTVINKKEDKNKIKMMTDERRNHSKREAGTRGTLIPRISPQGNALGEKERINDRIISKTVQRGTAVLKHIANLFDFT